jgi:hypothetical protein|tara:strand:+ start:101 stop:391 length:291 start_codon:yes stop_codon:yes gene_type:complete
MSTVNIGRARQGRRLKAGNNGEKPIQIKAGIGDGSTVNSATPFLKLSGSYGSDTDGVKNITTADVTGSGAAPTGTEKAFLVEVADTQYWVPIYEVV